MSSRGSKWLLFLLCVATLPLPFIALESGHAPPLRLLFIGSLTGGVLAQDPDPVSAILTGLYLGQGLLWAALLYFASRFVAKRLNADATRGIVVAVLAVLLIGASFFPIYRTPLSSSGLHSNILGIFD